MWTGVGLLSGDQDVCLCGVWRQTRLGQQSQHARRFQSPALAWRRVLVRPDQDSWNLSADGREWVTAADLFVVFVQASGLAGSRERPADLRHLAAEHRDAMSW